MNPDFPPLEERIQLTVTIDDNLILHAKAIAEDCRELTEEEYYDLEFSLVVRKQADDSGEKKNRLILAANKNGAKQLFVRANITNDKERWSTVPGELLKEYNDEHVYLRKPMTSVQDDEYIRYQPCSLCGAKWMKNCCSARAAAGQGLI